MRYFHFLQPNQYVPGSKPMGAAERRVAVREKHAYRIGVEMGYPLLEERFSMLQHAGVAFTDLRWIYQDHPEPLYSDSCCHLNKEGYAIMARAMASAIRSHIEIEGAEIESIRVEPANIAINDPRRSVSFQVLGLSSTGRELNLGATQLGTQIIAQDKWLQLDPQRGTARATRRGSSQILVSHGDQEAAVEVTTDWPMLLTSDDGVAAPDGNEPALRAFPSTSHEATRREALRVQLAECPSGTLAMLAVSQEPVPLSSLTQERLGELTLIPLVIDSKGRAQTSATLPQGAQFVDHALFLRAVFLEPQKRALVAASNSVVYTIE